MEYLKTLSPDIRFPEVGRANPAFAVVVREFENTLTYGSNWRPTKAT